jgi:hypothetical protein
MWVAPQGSPSLLVGAHSCTSYCGLLALWCLLLTLVGSVAVYYTQFKIEALN